MGPKVLLEEVLRSGHAFFSYVSFLNPALIPYAVHAVKSVAYPSYLSFYPLFYCLLKRLPSLLIFHANPTHSSRPFSYIPQSLGTRESEGLEQLRLL